MKKVWEVKRLGDICNIFSGGTPNSKKDNYWNGSIPFVTLVDTKNKYVYSTTRNITDEGLKNSSAILLPIDTVLLSTRATIGEVSIAKTPLCTNQGYKNFVCNKEILLPEFLYYGLILLKDYLLSLCKGAVYAEISKQGVSELKLPIPSLLEQQRIVKILDTAFAKIDTIKHNAERNLQNAKELFQAGLKDIINVQNTVLYKLGNDDLLQIIDGDRGVNYPKSDDFNDEGYCLFLNTKNVRPDGFNFESTMFISEKKDKELRKGRLERHDLVMTTRGTIGNLGVYSQTIPYNNIRINSGMLIFRPNLKIVTTEFLFWLFYSPLLKEQIKKHTTGAAQPQLPIKTLVNFIVPIPSLPVQNKIVTKLDTLSEKCKELENNYRQTITDCDEMKKSILAKTFNGEL